MTKKTKKKNKIKQFKKRGVSLIAFKKYLPIIKKISKIRQPNRIKNILNELPNAGINSICECIYNAIRSPHIAPSNLDKLHKLDINTKQLARKVIRVPYNKIKEKRQALYQIGGGLGTIIASVLPLLLNLFTRK